MIEMAEVSKPTFCSKNLNFKEHKKLRILIHDFAGHPFQLQLSRALSKRGYTVLHVYSKSVQTPKGAVQKRYEDAINFDVIGISQDKPFPKYSIFKRWLAEKSYSQKLLKITADFQPDIVISGNTPLDVQKRFMAHCKKKNIRFIFWVQDIYSFALRLALKKKLPGIGGFIASYYQIIEKRLLENSDQIVVISDDFKKIIEKWIKNNNISVVENWAPIDEIRPQPKKNYWSISRGISEKFCFLYSGTLGMKHNPDVLLQLARQYKNDIDTIIVIISEGPGAEWLKIAVAKERLSNVRFFNYVDFEELPFVLSSADVLIAILEKDAGAYCVPSKVLTYHCIGRPLLLSVPRKNLVSKIVINHASGLITEPEEIGAFCHSADMLKKNDRLRTTMGENAVKYANKKFNIHTKCNAFINCFN
jgi:colanic acid biosynthesis glycosyl transferase WcaI